MQLLPLLLGLLFVSMFAINQLPQSAGYGAVINGTSAFTIGLSINPFLELVFGILSAISSVIAIYGLMKDRYESRLHHFLQH